MCCLCVSFPFLIHSSLILDLLLTALFLFLHYSAFPRSLQAIKLSFANTCILLILKILDLWWSGRHISPSDISTLCFPKCLLVHSWSLLKSACSNIKPCWPAVIHTYYSHLSMNSIQGFPFYSTARKGVLCTLKSYTSMTGFPIAP